MKSTRRIIASGQSLRLCQRPAARQSITAARCLSVWTSPSRPSPSTSTICSQRSIAPIEARRNHASSTTPSSDQPLRKTGLYDFHLAHGAKMVPFGGFHMPLSYASPTALSLTDSHHFTRRAASLFDVGHMVQWHFSGPDAAAFLETITPSGIDALPLNRGTLSTLLHPDTGGIVDDCVITRQGGDVFYVVTNAANREKDSAYLAKELEAFGNGKGRTVKYEELAGAGLVALQGPLAKDSLKEVLADEDVNLDTLYFGKCAVARISLSGGRVSEPVFISRAGYTGEDGFELCIRPGDTVDVVEALLQKGTPERLQLAGLAVRDSLRLEAGMCLYGHDLDDTTTPVEAGLSWIIPKERREKGGFHGDKVILSQLTPKSKGGEGVERRRIGLTVTGAPAREGAEIVDGEGTVIGNVTSGGPSLTLGKNIAMGYIKDGFHKSGTEVGVLVRGKKRNAVVTKMPFVPTKYHKPEGKESGEKQRIAQKLAPV